MRDLWLDWLFTFVAISTIVCSIGVVVTQNIVRAAIWLLFALAATAGLFFLMSADFVGASQLLIYVGGTLVLVIFGVMLTARSPFVRMQTASGEWILAIVVGVTLFSLLAVPLLNWPGKKIVTDRAADTEQAAAASPTSVHVGLQFLGIPPQDLPAGQRRDPAGVGYLLPFEIVSVHLLVVLIGAAYLARAKRRRVQTTG